MNAKTERMHWRLQRQLIRLLARVERREEELRAAIQALNEWQNHVGGLVNRAISDK